MERLKIWGIIACVGLLFSPATAAGPPGGLDVKVVNPLTDPVNVCDVCEDLCIREPILIQKVENFSGGLGVYHLVVLEEVPVDKFLVIEMISVMANIGNDDRIRLSYLMNDNIGYVPLFQLPLHSFEPTLFRTAYGTTIAARAVVDTKITYSIDVVGPREYDTLLHVTLGGYLIDVSCPKP